jgi:hypothetical protein
MLDVWWLLVKSHVEDEAGWLPKLYRRHTKVLGGLADRVNEFFWFCKSSKSRILVCKYSPLLSDNYALGFVNRGKICVMLLSKTLLPPGTFAYADIPAAALNSQGAIPSSKFETTFSTSPTLGQLI